MNWKEGDKSQHHTEGKGKKDQKGKGGGTKREKLKKSEDFKGRKKIAGTTTNIEKGEKLVKRRKRWPKKRS